MDMYIVSATREPDEYNAGVEIAGIFDDEKTAAVAKGKVEDWMGKEGYEDGKVFSTGYEINTLKWYELNEKITGAKKTELTGSASLKEKLNRLNMLLEEAYSIKNEIMNHAGDKTGDELFDAFDALFDGEGSIDEIMGILD